MQHASKEKKHDLKRNHFFQVKDFSNNYLFVTSNICNKLNFTQLRAYIILLSKLTFNVSRDVYIYSKKKLLPLETSLASYINGLEATL